MSAAPISSYTSGCFWHLFKPTPSLTLVRMYALMSSRVRSLWTGILCSSLTSLLNVDWISCSSRLVTTRWISSGSELSRSFVHESNQSFREPVRVWHSLRAPIIHAPPKERIICKRTWRSDSCVGWRFSSSVTVRERTRLLLRILTLAVQLADKGSNHTFWTLLGIIPKVKVEVKYCCWGEGGGGSFQVLIGWLISFLRLLWFYN